MRSLAIDTLSMGRYSLAYEDPNKGAKVVTGHSVVQREVLLPGILRLFGVDTLQGVQPYIDTLVTSHGPGGFTAVRLGLSVTQALAFAFGLPVQPLSYLEVLAYAFAHQRSAVQGQAFLVVLPASMGTFFYAAYQFIQEGSNGLVSLNEMCAPQRAASPTQACVALEPVWVVTLPEHQGACRAFAAPLACEVFACEVGALAMLGLARSQKTALCAPQALMPQYLDADDLWQVKSGM